MVKLTLLGNSLEFRIPEFLKPEVPIISMLKRVSKFETVTVLRISDHGRSFNLCELKKTGHWIFDDLKRIRYMVQHPSIDLHLNLTSGKPVMVHAYILDDDGATTIELDKQDGEVKSVAVNGREVKKVEVPEELEGYEYRGTTISIIPDDIMIKFRADPDVWAAYADTHDISDMFAPGMNWGIIIVTFVAGAIVGQLIGGIIGVLLGHAF